MRRTRLSIGISRAAATSRVMLKTPYSTLVLGCSIQAQQYCSFGHIEERAIRITSTTRLACGVAFALGSQLPGFAFAFALLMTNSQPARGGTRAEHKYSPANSALQSAPDRLHHPRVMQRKVLRILPDPWAISNRSVSCLSAFREQSLVCAATPQRLLARLFGLLLSAV